MAERKQAKKLHKALKKKEGEKITCDAVRMRLVFIKMAASNQGAKLEKLQFQLEGFIESLRTVGVIAGDFQPNGQSNFNEKL